MTHGSHPALAAFVGLDGAEATPEGCRQTARSATGACGQLEPTPEAMDAWGTTRRTRCNGPPVALGLARTPGPLVSAWRQDDFLGLCPLTPLTLARSREACTPSRATDAPTDAALQLARRRTPRDTLPPLQPPRPTMRALAQLGAHRRRMVGAKVRLTNRLTDAAWELLKDVIPPSQPGGRHRERDMRAVVPALLDVVDGGSKGRRLPQAYPQWQRVEWSCRPWRDRGAWQRRHAPWRAQGRPQAGRPPPAGGRESHRVQTTALGGERGDEEGQKGKGRQRPLLVETLGLLLAIVVTAAAVSAPAGARRRLARLGGAWTKWRLLGVAGPERGQRGAWVSQQRRFVLRVTLPPEGTKGFLLRPRRGVVERTLAWRNPSRRLRTDYERWPQSSEAMMYPSMTRLMLRRLAAA